MRYLTCLPPSPFSLGVDWIVFLHRFVNITLLLLSQTFQFICSCCSCNAKCHSIQWNLTNGPWTSIELLSSAELVSFPSQTFHFIYYQFIEIFTEFQFQFECAVDDAWNKIVISLTSDRFDEIISLSFGFCSLMWRIIRQPGQCVMCLGVMMVDFMAGGREILSIFIQPKMS